MLAFSLKQAINCTCPDFWGPEFTDWICWVKTCLNNLRKQENPRYSFLPFSCFFFASSNITLIKKNKKKHIPFVTHVSHPVLESYFNCFTLFGACQQCVPWSESLNSCKATTGSSTGGKSSAIEPMCVYAITTVKRTWDWVWNSLLCIIFFRFGNCGYFTDSPKTALPQPKQKHIQGALSKRSM